MTSVSRVTPWASTSVAVRAATERIARRKLFDPDAQWVAPTGDTQRTVQVLPGERTCLECGDTFLAGGYCERCCDMRGKLPSVPTAQYLDNGEYTLI